MVLAIVSALVIGVLFGFTASESNLGTAIDVLVGDKEPFGTGLNAWAVALALAGWLVIPVLIGAIASIVVDESLRYMRAVQEERLGRLEAEVMRLKQRSEQVNESVGTRAQDRSLRQ